MIFQASTILNIGLYTSPFICFYIYKRGFFSLDETRTIIRYVGGLSCLIALSYILRGIGRASNPKYVEFLRALTSPVTDQKVYLEALRKYDFDFQAWPATYTLPPQKRSVFTYITKSVQSIRPRKSHVTSALSSIHYCKTNACIIFV